MMDNQTCEQIALHRYAVIAEALPAHLTGAERGDIVRRIADRVHVHPDGTDRRYSRATIDRWLRQWRTHGLDGLRPQQRGDTGIVRADPGLADVVDHRCVGRPVRAVPQDNRVGAGTPVPYRG